MLEALQVWVEKLLYPNSTLEMREKLLSLQIMTSATPAEVAIARLGIPEDVQGMTIYDLASGVSPLVADLAQRGADAHGVDVLYSLPLAAIEKRFPGDLTELVSRAPDEHQALLRDLMTQAMADWRESFVADKERYHAAFLTRLPFADDTADITVSSYGISNLADQPDIFWRSIQEALRVTKPNGKFVMAPLWLMDGSSLATEHKRMLRKLQKADIGEIVIDEDVVIGKDYDASFDRLTVVKH